MTYIEHIQKHSPDKLAKLEIVAKMMVEPSRFRDTMNLVFGDQVNKVDSAYPQQYMDNIREIYPNVREGNFCFSYIERNFGELVNLNDRLIKYLFS